MMPSRLSRGVKRQVVVLSTGVRLLLDGGLSGRRDQVVMIRVAGLFEGAGARAPDDPHAERAVVVARVGGGVVSGESQIVIPEQSKREVLAKGRLEPRIDEVRVVIALGVGAGVPGGAVTDDVAQAANELRHAQAEAERVDPRVLVGEAAVLEVVPRDRE